MLHKKYDAYGASTVFVNAILDNCAMGVEDKAIGILKGVEISQMTQEQREQVVGSLILKYQKNATLGNPWFSSREGVGDEVTAESLAFVKAEHALEFAVLLQGITSGERYVQDQKAAMELPEGEAREAALLVAKSRHSIAVHEVLKLLAGVEAAPAQQIAQCKGLLPESVAEPFTRDAELEGEFNLVSELLGKETFTLEEARQCKAFWERLAASYDHLLAGKLIIPNNEPIEDDEARVAVVHNFLDSVVNAVLRQEQAIADAQAAQFAPVPEQDEDDNEIDPELRSLVSIDETVEDSQPLDAANEEVDAASVVSEVEVVTEQPVQSIDDEAGALLKSLEQVDTTETPAPPGQHELYRAVQDVSAALEGVVVKAKEEIETAKLEAEIAAEVSSIPRNVVAKRIKDLVKSNPSIHQYPDEVKTPARESEAPVTIPNAVGFQNTPVVSAQPKAMSLIDVNEPPAQDRPISVSLESVVGNKAIKPVTPQFEPVQSLVRANSDERFPERKLNRALSQVNVMQAYQKLNNTLSDALLAAELQDQEDEKKEGDLSSGITHVFPPIDQNSWLNQRKARLDKTKPAVSSIMLVNPANVAAARKFRAISAVKRQAVVTQVLPKIK